MALRPDLLPALLAGAAAGAGLLLLVVAIRGLPRRAAGACRRPSASSPGAAGRRRSRPCWRW
jgi:hypothetical protein